MQRNSRKKDFLINFCNNKYFQPQNAMDKDVDSEVVLVFLEKRGR